jgi:hypothetical protein
VDNISELSAIMKTVFGPGIEQQQNLAAMLYKRFGQSQTKFGGNSYEFPARMVNSQSVGARGYRLSLPEPILNIDVTSRVRHKFMYGTFDIPGPDIEKGKGNVNAFVNTLTDKMRSLTEMMLKDMNMQTYLDGTGVRATLTETDATTATNGLVGVDRIKYLRNGMHVNIVDAGDGVTLLANGESDPSEASGTTYAWKRFTIMSIAAGTTVSGDGGRVQLGTGSPLAITAPTADTIADQLVRHKAMGVELTGLDAIVDDGTNNAGALILQDIDRSTSPLWQAKVLGNSGTARPLTLNLMQVAMDIPEVVSGRRIDLVVGSYNARDAYLQLLVPQKRFMDLKLDGGFQVLEYNGRDFLVDVDCQDDTIYFLNRASIQKFGLFDLKFVEQTGGILKHDSLSAGDVFYGFMRAICNLGTTQANANSKITDLVVDTNYVVAG